MAIDAAARIERGVSLFPDGMPAWTGASYPFEQAPADELEPEGGGAPEDRVAPEGGSAREAGERETRNNQT